MNAKTAKRLRRQAGYGDGGFTNTYELNRAGRLVDIVIRGHKVKFKYSDSIRLTKSCWRGAYRALKKEHRRAYV